MTDTMMDTYDVVVVGGGAAGLNGALLLGRARRSVLVIDAGEPRNAPAAAVHGFLSRDGVPPSELTEIARAEVRGYGATIMHGRVTSAARADKGFTVTLDDGTVVGARRLLVTTGLVDELPDLPGIRERWGRDVLHCPYCHGWEVRDQAIGVLASGPMAVHQALLFRQWTANLVLLLHTTPQPDPTEAEQLAARDIKVISGTVTSLLISDDRLVGIRMSDGSIVALQALVVGPRFAARSEVLATLGLEPTPHPLGFGEYVAADSTGLTAVPGVWVAGNVADLAAGVVNAAAAGSWAGATINADLISEEVQDAVAARRDPSPATVDARL